MSTRTDLSGLLDEHLPEGWKIIPFERDIDPPTATVAMVRQHRISFDESIGHLIAHMDVTVITKHTDSLQNAEDNLDDVVNTLLATLLGIVNIRVASGTKIRFGERGYPAWNIDIEIPLERKL